jgi:hypothetical protein
VSAIVKDARPERKSGVSFFATMVNEYCRNVTTNTASESTTNNDRVPQFDGEPRRRDDDVAVTWVFAISLALCHRIETPLSSGTTHK